jgi:hypothetical protein
VNPFPGNLPPIQREIAAFGKKTPGNVETSPGAGDADIPPWPAHPRGKVLEVTNRVSQKTGGAVGGVFQNPFERGVGPRPFFQNGIIVLQIGGEGFVEL